MAFLITMKPPNTVPDTKGHTMYDSVPVKVRERWI